MHIHVIIRPYIARERVYNHQSSQAPEHASNTTAMLHTLWPIFHTKQNFQLSWEEGCFADDFG